MPQGFTPTGGGLDLTLADIEQAEYALALRLGFDGAPNKDAIRRAMLMFQRIRQSASHYPDRPVRVFLTKPLPPAEPSHQRGLTLLQNPHGD